MRNTTVTLNNWINSSNLKPWGWFGKYNEFIMYFEGQN